MATPNEIGSSVSVNVGPQPSEFPEVNRRLSIRKFGDGFETNEIFVDVFPDATGLNVSSTSGSLSNPVSRLERNVEYLTFTDSNEAQLKHSDVENLVLTRVGDFRNVNGILLPSIISFDGATSTVRLSTKSYGVVRATYDAPFLRYTFRFKGSCPVERPAIDPDTKQETEIFERATIIATLPSTLFGVAATSLTVENSNDRCPFEVTTGEKNTIKMEILNSRWSGAKGSVKYETTIGVFPSGLSGLTIKGGQVNPTRVTTRTLKVSSESMTFNNSSNASLRYAVQNIVVVNDLGGLIDAFGKTFEPTFIQPGGRVTLGTWDSAGNFTPSGQIITVKKGEVYITDPSGRERQVTGTVRTSYEVKYDEYSYIHKVTEENDSLKIVAQNDILTARSENLVGILPIPQGFKLDPKLRGGRTTT